MIGCTLAGILITAFVVLTNTVVYAQESRFKYDDMGYYGENLTKVKINGKWGYIGKNGLEIIPAAYDEIGGFGWFDLDDMATIKRNGKMGYINLSGKEIVAPKYDLTTDFVDDRGKVMADGKWGYIDPTGKEIIAPIYEEAQEFSRDGLAGVKLKGHWGYIRPDGTAETWSLK